MSRLPLIAAFVALSLSSPALLAQSSSTASKSAPSASGKAAPATPSRQALKNQAKGLALATTTVQAISENQLEIASRVLTGRSDCEFDQSVSVAPIDGRPGHFKVGYKNANYTMVPEETTTGAVRLEDKRAGMVWLQIPSKSMLMNSKIGQRVVDACVHPTQRVAAR